MSAVSADVMDMEPAMVIPPTTATPSMSRPLSRTRKRPAKISDAARVDGGEHRPAPKRSDSAPSISVNTMLEPPSTPTTHEANIGV